MSASYIFYLFDLLLDDFEGDGDGDDNDHDHVVNEEHLHSGLFAISSNPSSSWCCSAVCDCWWQQWCWR